MSTRHVPPSNSPHVTRSAMAAQTLLAEKGKRESGQQLSMMTISAVSVLTAHVGHIGV